MITRAYSELEHLLDFNSRFNYLKLGGEVGASTFGFDRWINQRFYKSHEWRRARDFVIVRDGGCDLGVSGYEIYDSILVHHINPMVADDIVNGDDWILNPDYLISTTQATHNAIHYGTDITLPKTVIERKPGDTSLW